MIPEAAVDAARDVLYENDRSIDIDYATLTAALEAAAPHMLAAKVAEAKANNDHIVEGGDGYSAGFHYALQCISQDV